MKNRLHAILCASVLVLCQCSADPNENQLLTHFTAIHKSDSALPGQTIPPKNLVEIQLQRARAFRAALPEDLYQWTVNEPNLYATVLNEFLDDYTPAHEFAAVNMIWSMAYNANYSGDTFFADNDPETQLWSGPLQVIPTALDCGENTIKINFLTTASDGANAQQPVEWLVWSGGEEEVIASGTLASAHALGELQERAGGAWIVRDVIGGGDVAIASLGLAIPLTEIYA